MLGLGAAERWSGLEWRKEGRGEGEWLFLSGCMRDPIIHRWLEDAKLGKGGSWC